MNKKRFVPALSLSVLTLSACSSKQDVQILEENTSPNEPVIVDNNESQKTPQERGIEALFKLPDSWSSYNPEMHGMPTLLAESREETVEVDIGGVHYTIQNVHHIKMENADKDLWSMAIDDAGVDGNEFDLFAFDVLAENANDLPVYSSHLNKVTTSLPQELESKNEIRTGFELKTHLDSSEETITTFSSTFPSSKPIKWLELEFGDVFHLEDEGEKEGDEEIKETFEGTKIRIDLNSIPETTGN